MTGYRTVPIEECHDPLRPIPLDDFAITAPHPYARIGAPYGAHSPWQLRQKVLNALSAVQAELGRLRPGWRLKLFDAYRPIEVQAFMVWREFRAQAARASLELPEQGDPATLVRTHPDLFALLAPSVFRFWGIPSNDPRTPPPHATGAAIDLTLEDAAGREVDMGCPIDETTERAYPNHYAADNSAGGRRIHGCRLLLKAVMTTAGFAQHPNEWWHFSMGDQMWAWTLGKPAARYGRADLTNKAELTCDFPSTQRMTTRALLIE